MTWGREGVDASACRAQIPGTTGPILSEYQAPRHPHSPASQGPQGILSVPLANRHHGGAHVKVTRGYVGSVYSRAGGHFVG